MVVKVYLKHPLHAKLYLLYREDRNNPITAFLGSSNLTFSGLSFQGELNVDVLEHDATQKLKKWFQDRWADRLCVDISAELADIIDESWAGEKETPPYHIYLKMAYHLSREARAGLTEFAIPRVFEGQLLEFQEKAVKIAAHHLHKRGGVLIGDVVGLGKSFTGTALAKIFEEDFFMETLIICPKNLVAMWEDYRLTYSLNAKVLSITQVQQELPKLRRFRLVLIDESHNLRNRQSKRYGAIREYLQKNDSKVILLSATPYNKTYLDLSSQLRLFLPDDIDLGISPENYIESLGGRTEFSAKYQYSPNTLQAFEKSDDPDDWRELMRLYLVRRTRSFIREYYAEEDPQVGRKYLRFPDGSRSYFPDRLAKRVEYDFDPTDETDQYAQLYSTQVVDIITQLKLPRYGLSKYLTATAEQEADKLEKQTLENLSRAGQRLIGFTRTGLFKRLESSGHAFLLSLCRHAFRNYLFVHALQHKLPLPIGEQDPTLLNTFLSDMDIEALEDESELGFLLEEDEYLKRAEKLYGTLRDVHFRKFQWIRSSLFKRSLKQHLRKDCQDILSILTLAKAWDPARDRQLNALEKLLQATHREEKVLIFTQYADTARYLGRELTAREVPKLEVVTGGHPDPTRAAHRFSPVSNKQATHLPPEQELNVLITTDVLSEGQNLQDAHIVLNYDLPWAIIRLIQRAGRVDRIGQQAEQILCYSFWPEDGIERIINLRGRLENRLKQNAEVVGNDETFFDGEIDDVQLRNLYSEQSGILDEEDDQEIDLASLAYQIWKNATDADEKLLKIIPELPDVIYSSKAESWAKPEEEGTLLYARTATDNDLLTWVNHREQIITQSQLRILRAAACSAQTPAIEKHPKHHQLVQRGMKHILEAEKKLGGQLGSKTSIRYRVWQRMNAYFSKYEDTLLVNHELKKAIDEIYSFPLTEYAKESIGRQMRLKVDDDILASTVTNLRDNQQLCHVKEQEDDQEPRIICSLGLRRNA